MSGIEMSGVEVSGLEVSGLEVSGIDVTGAEGTGTVVTGTEAAVGSRWRDPAPPVFGQAVGEGVGAGAAARGVSAAEVTASPAGEAARVLSRLERIEALDREHAPPQRLLGELRELVREAEAWARAEGDGRARAAAGKLREGAEGMS